jgi:hypothetical protein
LLVLSPVALRKSTLQSNSPVSVAKSTQLTQQEQKNAKADKVAAAKLLAYRLFSENIQELVYGCFLVGGINIA